MKDYLEIFFENRTEFHSWLKSNHAKSNGIWMVYYKNHTEKSGIMYREALEEALCFGWRDSLIRRIDESRYARKFSPRTNVSNWSDVNKKIVLSLIERGLMRKEGLMKIDEYAQTGKFRWSLKELNKPRAEYKIPDYVLKGLSVNEKALLNFNKLAPSHQKQYAMWIDDAKKQETRDRRLAKAIEMLRSGKKLGF